MIGKALIIQQKHSFFYGNTENFLEKLKRKGRVNINIAPPE